MKKTLLVMGGDRRMEFAAERLSDAFDVYTYGLGESVRLWDLKQADIVVLPYVSLSGDKIPAPLFDKPIPSVSAPDMLKYGGALFGGGLGGSFLSYCSERCARVYDYLDDEELTQKNAYLTAEGALEIVLRETEIAIKGLKVSVLGYGRVAKATAEVFSALGAEVTISARSELARAQAITAGYTVKAFIEPDALCGADVIINTVPHLVIKKPQLECLTNGAFILDLASKPFGTDFEAAKELGIKAITAPGLPGKTAPKSAGILIAESVLRALEEE